MTENPRFSYRAITEHKPFRWPGGAGVALWVIPNIECYHYDTPGATLNERSALYRPDVLNYSWREYGPRVGVWRIMECLDRVGIRATVALNSQVCDQYPQIIREGVARHWDWMGHGQSNTRRIGNMDEETEQKEIRGTLERITEATGQWPAGWLGPGLTETYLTPDILQENGVEYVADWIADDLPFWMKTRQGHLLSIPYSIEINDFEMFMGKKVTGPEFRDAIIDQFRTLYRESQTQNTARVMAVATHPFLVGQGHRIQYLEEALKYIVEQEAVWNTTGAEIARYYRDHVQPSP